MAILVLRQDKGSPLTFAEVDGNFTALNDELATATSANTSNAPVKRDASGNFSAGTITAALSGAASSNVLKAGDLLTGALGLISGTASAPGAYFSGDINTGIYRPAADTFGITTAGVERMRFRSDGNIGIGGTGSGLVTLYNQGGITGGTTAYGNFTAGVIQSVVTGSAFVNRTNVSTAAAAFTTTTLYHYSAGLATLGAGSAITNNFGFYAEPGLGTTSAAQVATVYGFRGDIASATGRWNFFAAGTAPNYFAGDVRTAGASTKYAAPADSAVAVILTAASIIDGIRTATPTVQLFYTLPTGFNLDAAFQDLQSNQSFEWSVINRASVNFRITLLANTTHSVFGNMVTEPASSGRFLTRKTTTNTFVTYRIG